MSEFEYEIDDSKVTITRYRGAGGDVVVPDTIDGLPVTSIGAYAFRDCTGLTSITLPNSVTSIGDSAFERCVFLTSISLPDGCSIGEYAFEGCPAVITVRLRKSRCYIYFRDKADIRR